MGNLWFPGANLDHKAPVDGGSILGGKPKCLWHDTETVGLPSYSTNYWPNMTICRGVPYQHIPANRAARALRNEAGGVQTNRWNVFQIEVCGYANRVTYYPIMGEVAEWLHDVRGCPLTETLDWLSYPDSAGASHVRMSYAEWGDYSGHCAHMHAPENTHGDTGWPFPIAEILGEHEEDDLTPEQAADQKAILAISKELKAHTITTGGDKKPTSDATLAYRRTVNGVDVPMEGGPSLRSINRKVDAIIEHLGIDI
jgi:hypothetical protein